MVAARLTHPPHRPDQRDRTYKERRNECLQQHVGPEEIDHDGYRIEYQYYIEQRHLLGE
ncbi:hypothetical protein V2I08_10090 [Sphingobium sp. MK2]